MSPVSQATTMAVGSDTQWNDRDRAPPPGEAGFVPGDRLGRYRLDRVLGRGGMGVVYAAFDPQLHRRVALKVLRPSGTTTTSRGEAQARLLREAKALAGLVHPNVITVYDVGRLDEQVYLAMELVTGPTLKAWIGRGPHPWRRVLEVMVQAGRGLVAAHDSGIVHRDFKPGNVLLGEDGRVRVLDFGLARSRDGLDPSGSLRGTDRFDSSAAGSSSQLPALTEAGAVMGTPGYMSPEQTAGETLDARSDQFSFCVTLYEALYKERPHPGESRRAWARSIRLGRFKGPPADSQVPDRLRRMVLRGLAPDPEARWPTLQALLAALERTIDGRARARIRWAALGTTTCGGVLAMSLWTPQDDRCQRSTDAISRIWNEDVSAQIGETFARIDVAYAADTWSRVEPTLQAYVADWVVLQEQTCRATDAELAPAVRDLQLSCLARRRAELSALVEILSEPDEQTVRGAVSAASNLDSLDECAADWVDAAGLAAPPPNLEDEVQALRERLASVPVYREARRLDRALELGKDVLAQAEALDYPPLRAEALYRHGRTLEDLADYSEAAEHMEEAFYLALQSGHDEVAADAARSLYFMFASRQGDMPQAATWLGHAESATQRLGERGERARWRLAQDRGSVELREANFERAEAILSEAVALARAEQGEDNLMVAAIIGNLGVAQMNLGELDEAWASFEECLRISETLVGPDHPDRASWYNNLGVIEQNRGNHEASLEYFRRSFEIESSLLGLQHPSVAMSLNNIGGALAYLGRDREAKEYFERAIDSYSAVDGVDALDRARPVGNLGHVLVGLGEHEQGVARLLEAISMIETAAGPDHPELSAHHINLGSAYLQLGQHHAALEQMERALRIDRNAFGPNHPFVASTLASMGEVHLDLGKPAEALPMLEQAHRIQETQGDQGVDPVNLAATRFGLARALWPDPSQRKRARELVALSIEGLEAAGEAGADRLSSVKAWQASH